MKVYNEILMANNINNSDDPAVSLGQIAYTYDELIQKVDSVADDLSCMGVKKNAKVLVLIDNPLYFIFEVFAINKLDAVCIPLYAQTGVDKVSDIIQEYDINYIIMNNKNKNTQLSFESQTIDTMEGMLLFKCCEEYDDSLENIALILFTSGTTNIPKAIMLSENNIISNVEAISKYLKLNNNDIVLLIKNMSHSSSIIGELFVSFRNGCKVVLPESIPLTSNIIKILERENITVFFAVPTILLGIISNRNFEKYNLSSIRIVNFYGAAMSAENIQRIVRCLPDANIIYSYGLTEASPRVTYIEKKDIVRKCGSSGKAIDKVSFRIVNEQGETVGPNEKGEIVVSGPNVMQGYYRRDNLTKKVIKNSELYSGDIGYVDKEGYLYVTGRRDCMFIIAGKNIYPEEIEGVLTSHKDIQEALVQKYIDEKGNSHIVSTVVLSEKKELDYMGILEYCNRHLENYKIPRKIIVADSLKKTASGKIIRNQTAK